MDSVKAKAVFLLAVFLTVFTIGCGNTQAEKPASQYGKAPDFELTDINGRTFKLSDYKGKIIFLNFFATWCPPCRAEMPDFNEIAAEYAKNAEVIAIGVGRESEETVRQFAERNGLKFTVAVDDGKASTLYGPISAIPVTVVINKNFNIVKRYIGSRTKAIFESDIEELQ